MTTVAQLYAHLATPEHWQERELPATLLECSGCGATTRFVWSSQHIPALPEGWRYCWAWDPEPPSATSRLCCPSCAHPDVVPNDDYPF